MARDTWHVTCDMWLLTCDMWHVTHGGMWTFSQNFRSLAQMVWEWRCLEDLEENDHWINEFINEWQRCLLNSPGYTGSVKNKTRTKLKWFWDFWCTQSFFIHLVNIFIKVITWKKLSDDHQQNSNPPSMFAFISLKEIERLWRILKEN